MHAARRVRVRLFNRAHLVSLPAATCMIIQPLPMTFKLHFFCYNGIVSKPSFQSSLRLRGITTGRQTPQLRLITNNKESSDVKNDKRRRDAMVRAVAQALAFLGILVQLGFTRWTRIVLVSIGRNCLDIVQRLTQINRALYERSIYLY